MVYSHIEKVLLMNPVKNKGLIMNDLIHICKRIVGV